LAEPLAVKEAMLELFPDLVATYGESAAALAADYYDELRESSGVPGRFSAVAAGTVPVEQVEASTRWGLGALFGGAGPDASFGSLGGVLDRYVKQAGRDTVTGSARRDPRRASFARVPSGSSTCAFCMMLASRGAVYESKASAGDMHKYHGDCDCQPVAVWSESDLPDGYDPDALYEKYLDIHDPGMSGRQTAAAWRAEYGTN
jgi:hypothetical protein